MEEATKNKLKALVRNVPDFPVKGIQFKDLTTLLKDAEALHIVTEEMAQLYRDRGITKVAGIEARGFIGGALLANAIGAGFVPIRKPGKLPADTVSKTYEKEYGSDTIELHRDAIGPDDIVLLHDDLLATGGTMLAALQLVQSMHPKKVMVNFVCELSFLRGRDVFPDDIEVDSLFEF